ncbi:isoprenylcysteine carboxylmethyltransferase family protein [Aliifodinibius sp. S!AR15-10]|uniref:methanethiol S-methyltransferase n=1 Tax=Aliifodinibius sp. S!AR15-10 TaxID=2950437 RepID=UPI00285D8875|nr:methanethiol S-methyltransferase [Aliifodinibius sp. S!AR15-10]MDR8393297.1 isoprenylcysteine carboxylmethyltransferase family protein [Aliifodinibius sp. S!AR15-10]
MKRFSVFVYGVLCYLIFFASFVWLILFVGDFETLVPTTLNGGTTGAWPQAVLINIGLIALFGIQHTVMARKSFKKWWTSIVAQPIERSTYVLFSSLAVLLLLWFWQPITATVWNIEVTWASLILQWAFWLGWLILFLSTWMIDHFNLFGLKQVWNYWRGNTQNPPGFMKPGFYKFVRHPLMAGFLIAFWATPHMTAGHLLFSAGMTIYILVGVYFEEKAMVRRFGEDYKEYREEVPRFFPGM